MKKRRKKPKITNAILEVGKFYNVHDGSRHGHPGRIEIIDLKNDTFISITTRSLTKEEYEDGSFRKSYKELSKTTSKDVYKSVVHKRPFSGSKLDYGKEYPNLNIAKEDERIIKIILNKKPRIGYWKGKTNKKPSK